MNVWKPVIKTQFLFTSTCFPPTLGELDEGHDDFINPGIFALNLADFLSAELAKREYSVRFRCQEDWGHWLELEHAGQFTLAIGCSNTEEAFGNIIEHRAFIEPNKPTIRRFFRKIDVRKDVEQLAIALEEIFESSEKIENIRVEVC